MVLEKIDQKDKIPGKETGVEIKKSICTICDPRTQCGLDLYVKDGTIIKVEGSKSHPNNAGTICSKGAATRQYIYHSDRIKTPLKQIGKGSGRFEPITWDEALDTIAEKLNGVKEEYSADSVAFYVGYPKGLRPFLHRFASSFGSQNYMTESSTCNSATTMAQKLTFGIPGGPDVPNTNCLLVWSSNPFYTNTSGARGILAKLEGGMKMIVVDPRYSPMAAHADIHLQLKPGTDGALALAMANIIIAENLYDKEFVSNYSHGFDKYADHVKGMTPERASQITGVPIEKIYAAARMYATTKPAAIMPSASPVVHHTNGVQNYRAVFCLAGLTGNYDIKGGNFAQPQSFAYQEAGFVSRSHEFTLSDNLKSDKPRVGSEKFPVWNILMDEGQAMDLPNQINSGKPYPIKALFAMGLNYRMWPDSEFFAESLKKLDFVVNVDLFMTDSCKFADIVLPCCSSLERYELRAYPQKYIMLAQPAIDPLYESRSDADILFELTKRMELDDPLMKEGYEACIDWMLEPSGMTFSMLKQHESGMPVPNPIDFPEKKYINNGFKTPSGKMEFESMILEQYADKPGYDALPTYHPSKYSAENAPDMSKEYPFILGTGSRLPMFIHSRAFRMDWTKSLRPDPAADINIDDAKKLGLKQNDDVRLVTNKGAINVKANITNTVLPGVVHMFHGYPEANVNTLIEADYLDPISGFPGFKSLLCRIEKA